jgi:hypothetical protein
MNRGRILLTLAPIPCILHSELANRRDLMHRYDVMSGSWTAIVNPVGGPQRSGGARSRLLALLFLTHLLLLTACRTTPPATPEPGPVPKPDTGEPQPIPTPDPGEPMAVVVRPSYAVTNSLQHVTYKFELPRKPERGYIIEESLDGEEWLVYGRSSSTELRSVTIVDATPDSGREWRVKLP